MKKNIFVSELFYPNQTSTAYILTEIVKKFVAEGEKVKVVTTKVQYDSNTLGSKKLDGVEIIEVKSLKGDKNVFVTRVFNALFNSIGLGWKTYRNIAKDDTVFAVTNPIFLILLLAIIKKIKIFDYILLVHDVFPENTIPAGVNKKNTIVYNILLKIYNWAYKSASKVIVLGKDMENLMLQKGVVSEDIEVIPNWFDEDLTNHINDLDQQNNLINNGITIGFAGNIGRVQSLERFINIYNQNNNSNLRLTIIGEGANLIACKNESKNDSIKFLGAKPRSEQFNFLQKFDIGLITLAEGMYGLGVPSKTYNLLALGKPVLYIGDENSEIDILNKESDIGWSFTWSQNQEILNLLNSIRKADLKRYYSTNSSLGLNRFSSGVLLEKIYQFSISK